jgi:hypothetical protein
MNKDNHRCIFHLYDAMGKRIGDIIGESGNDSMMITITWDNRLRMKYSSLGCPICFTMFDLVSEEELLQRSNREL